MAPSPQGRRRRPWVPLGPFGSPWVPLGPFGPPWPPRSWGSPGVPGGVGWGWGPWGAFGSKGSAPCRSEKRASRKLGGGADSAGENILGRRHARKRIWIYDFCSNIAPKRPLRVDCVPKISKMYNFWHLYRLWDMKYEAFRFEKAF